MAHVLAGSPLSVTTNPLFENGLVALENKNVGTSAVDVPTLHNVRGGGLEPPPSIRGLAPQASASAYSATRAHVTFIRWPTKVSTADGPKKIGRLH